VRNRTLSLSPEKGRYHAHSENGERGDATSAARGEKEGERLAGRRISLPKRSDARSQAPSMRKSDSEKRKKNCSRIPYGKKDHSLSREKEGVFLKAKKRSEKGGKRGGGDIAKRER